mmetsp:Transcript_25215/g.61180  ORF Transcript_25215/g.61180 Transcript_25215/m.61180 type:complete len:305 (+) Transcript_25215:1131-2045(+)
MSPMMSFEWLGLPLIASIRSIVSLLSLHAIGKANSLQSLPLRALVRTSCACSLSSSERKDMKSIPIASLAEYLVSSAILWFHSLTLRFRSVPKMGLLAPSMICRSSLPTLCTLSFSAVTFLKSVTSCPEKTMATTRLPIHRTLALHRHTAGTPSLRTRPISKLLESLPCKAAAITRSNWPLCSMETISLLRCFPITSSLVQPVTSSHFLFHSNILRRELHAKMGAFARWRNVSSPPTTSILANKLRVWMNPTIIMVMSPAKRMIDASQRNNPNASGTVLSDLRRTPSLHFIPSPTSNSTAAHFS